MLRFLIYAILLLLMVAATAHQARAIDAEWLAPTSGEWTAAENWSSFGFPDANQPSNRDRYDVTINAAGASYEVRLGKPNGSGSTAPRIEVDSLLIDSPGATLRVVDDSFLSAIFGGVHVAQGTLLLDGATIHNFNSGAIGRTRLSAGPGGAIVSGATRANWFDGVTLATDFVANEQLIILEDDVTLENATLSFARGAFYQGADLIGVGEWRLESGQPDSFDFDYNINYYESPGNAMVIGPDVTVRSMGHFVTLRNGSGSTIESIGVVLNQGTMIHETDGGYLYIEGFRNEGLVRVAGGDRFAARYRGAVGNVELGPGGNLWLYGDPHFDQPVTIGDGASVWIPALNQATADVPLQLQPGGTLRLTPEGIVPVTATGGEVLLDDWQGRNSYTVTELTNLPVTGPADVHFTGAGVDLEGGVFDYTTLPANIKFNPPFVENGTLTGPSQPADLRVFDLRNARLDITWDIAATHHVELWGASELVQPVTVSGGTLVLDDDWTNTGGITVTDGELQLYTAGASPGAISMTGGTLGVRYSTTLASLLGLGFGAPEQIDIGSTDGFDSGSTLDLEGGTIDLDAWPRTQWAIQREGNIENGVITGSHDGPTLQNTFGRLVGITLDGVKTNGGSFGDSTLNNVWATGSASTSGLVINSRIDGGLSGGTIQGTLQIGNYIRGNVLFDAGSSITGTAALGATGGRGNRDTFTFVDPTYTLPAGIDIVSATQYDSNATVEAASTALTVEGDIRVGHETFIRDSWTDSITFNVQSLTTHGETTVTEDGRLYVTGGPWTTSGPVNVTGGEIEVDVLHVTETAELRGWGKVTGDLTIDGRLAADNPAGQLSLTGDLSLTGTATVELMIGNPSAGPALVIDGALALDGELLLEFTAEALATLPEVGDQFLALEATTLAGQFDSLASTLPWLQLTPIYTADSVLVEVAGLTNAPPLRGDANGDGVVDAMDYALWRENLGETVEHFTSGDLDGSGVVDGYDYAVWQAAFGAQLPLPGAPAPEPMTGLLIAFSLAALSTRNPQTATAKNVARRPGVELR